MLPKNAAWSGNYFPQPIRQDKTMLRRLRIFYLATAIALAASILSTSSVSADTTNVREVLETYANIALAKFQDSLSTAQALDSAIGNLLDQFNLIKIFASGLQFFALTKIFVSLNF